MKTLALYLYVFLHTTFCGCGNDARHSGIEKIRQAYHISQIARLPSVITECSGLVLTASGNLLAHNDGGGKTTLFEITPAGKLVAEQPVPETQNRDWEDLARDNRGHIYIGDFGNNQNNRKDLRIYKIREADFSLVGQIRFSYPDQKSFPADKHNRNFDCEAFFWLNDSLHLFSKDRSKRPYTKYYRLPDQPGTYVATLSDSLRLNTMITGASISPDQQTVALLGYGKIFLLGVSGGRPMLQEKAGCMGISLSAQAEAISFINNTDLVFANEQGKLFLVRKK